MEVKSVVKIVIGPNGKPALGHTAPQLELITTTKQFPAMVAGFGAGKTNALIHRCIQYKLKYPMCNVAYYLPTYDHVRTIAFPRFQEMLAEYGYIEGGHNADYKLIQNLTPMIEFHRDGGQIIFRTMNNPGRIIGYEVADSFVDELDTLKEKDARLAWQKLFARNRQKKPDGAKNTIAVGTTPEGFRFTYQQWKKKPPSNEYHLIKASTYSNAHNLPEGYVDDIRAEYPTNLVQAYIEGEFVNLTSGSIYFDYDRIKNGSNETVQPNETLHIGMDFNVTKMAAVTFVPREGWPHAVAEIVNQLDTPNMIMAIKNRFPNHPIIVYPDASGAARKSNNASVSDIGLLEAAGFMVLNNPSNPYVKDRILSMNKLICTGIAPNENRRLKVNADQCPHFAEALEKQAYDDKGEPDKSSGHDHVNDAGGYFINYRYPVVGRDVQMLEITGA
jgi:Terminase large subunit, T4likevirus-type, N-terminal/Terminase RNaseH-like domain